MAGLDLPDWNAAMKDTLELDFQIQISSEAEVSRVQTGGPEVQRGTVHPPPSLHSHALSRADLQAEGSYAASPTPGNPSNKQGKTPLRSGVKGRAIRVAGGGRTPAISSCPRPSTGLEGVLKRLAFATSNHPGTTPTGEQSDPAAKQLCFSGLSASPSTGDFPSQTPNTGRRVRFAVTEDKPKTLSSPGHGQALSSSVSDAGSTPYHGLLRKYGNEEDDDVSGTPDIGKLAIDDVWDSRTASSVSDSIRALTSSAPRTELGSTAGSGARFAANTPGTTASSIGWQPNRLFGASPVSSPDSTGAPTPSCATPAIILGGPSHRHRLAIAAGPTPAAPPPPPPLPQFSASTGAVAVQSEFVLFADLHREDAEDDISAETSVPRSPLRTVPSNTETLRSWPVADLSPVTSPWHGPDGIKRTSEGIPVETPATVTVFRGGRPPSSHRGATSNSGLTGSSFSSLATDLFGAAATMTPAGESVIKSDDQVVEDPTTTSLVDGEESLDQQQAVAVATPSTTLFPANPKTPSRLGSAIRVPLHMTKAGTEGVNPDIAGPPASSIKQNRELTALLADLSIQETEALAAGSQDIARGTLSMLTPVRTSMIVRQATGQAMAATPARRSARKLSQPMDVCQASESALATVGFAYVPNPALGEQQDSYESPLVAQDCSPALGDQTPLGLSNKHHDARAIPKKGKELNLEENKATPADSRRRQGLSSESSLGMSPTEQGIRRSLRRSARKAQHK